TPHSRHEMHPTKCTKVTKHAKKNACDRAREAGHATDRAPKTQNGRGSGVCVFRRSFRRLHGRLCRPAGRTLSLRVLSGLRVQTSFFFFVSFVLVSFVVVRFVVRTCNIAPMSGSASRRTLVKAG